MRLSGKTRIFVLFFIASIKVFCQSSNGWTQMYDFMPDKNLILSPYMDYSKLQDKDYLSFLDKLYDSDQYYRVLSKKSIGDDNSKAIIKSMKTNDLNNAKIILKLFQKFGWPCSSNENHSFYAWIILWHNRYESSIIYEFEPFLDVALKNNCVNVSHYSQLKPFCQKK